MEIRWAKQEDVPVLDELWYTCFGDDERFRSWFFANRFWPELCLTACEEDIPVGAVYGLPVHLRIRDKRLPAVIIGGVCTHPLHRGKGIMHAVFTRFMREMHTRHCPLTFLHPVREDLYFSLGHYTCCDRGFVTRAPGASLPAAGAVTSLPLGQRMEELHRCYLDYIHGYSGPTDRSEEEFRFKMSDYEAGGGKLLISVNSDHIIDGYCLYFEDKQEILGEECVFTETTVRDSLIAALAAHASQKKLTVKVPADRLPSLTGFETAAKPWGCMGMGHVSALLEALFPGETGFSIAVTDSIVPENSGCYDLNGKASALPPQLSLEAGRLMQWLSGYRSPAQLAAEGHAVLLDKNAARRLDELLPVQSCLCSDEY